MGNETEMFNCTGNRSNIFWLVDGQSTNAVVIQQRGVKAAQMQLIGSLVYSSLTIPKTESNNGTEVKCLVIDYGSSTIVSAPVILTLQGKRIYKRNAHTLTIIMYKQKAYCYDK